MLSPLCIPNKTNAVTTPKQSQTRKSIAGSTSMDYSNCARSEIINILSPSCTNKKKGVRFKSPSASKMNLTFCSSGSSADVFQFKSKDTIQRNKTINLGAFKSATERTSRIPLFREKTKSHFTPPHITNNSNITIRKPLQHINNGVSPKTPKNLPFKLPANGTPLTPAMERLIKDYNSPSASQRARALNILRSGISLDEDSSDDEIAQLRAQIPKRAERLEDVLKGIVAYVEVRAGEDNRSYGIKAILRDMGATVLDKFLKDVTHVVFKEGLMSTYKKAKNRNVHLVSVLWIEACKMNMYKVHESLYPPSDIEAYESPHAKIRRVRSMQPDFEGTRFNKNKKNVKKKAMNEPIKDTSITGLENPTSEPNIFKKKLAETSTERYIDILRQLGGTDIQEYSEDTPPYPSSISDFQASNGSENDKMLPLAVRLMKQFLSKENANKNKSVNLQDDTFEDHQNPVPFVSDKCDNQQLPKESMNVGSSLKEVELNKNPVTDTDSFISEDIFTQIVTPVSKKHKRNDVEESAEITSNSDNFVNNSCKETQINKSLRISSESKSESNTSTNADSDSLRLYLSISDDSKKSETANSSNDSMKRSKYLVSLSTSTDSRSSDKLIDGCTESPKPENRRRSVRVAKLINKQENSKIISKSNDLVKERTIRSSRKSLFNYTHSLDEVSENDIEMECDSIANPLITTDKQSKSETKETATKINNTKSSNSVQSSISSVFVTPQKPKQTTNTQNNSTKNIRSSKSETSNYNKTNNESLSSSDAFQTPNNRSNRRKSFLIAASKTKLIIGELEALSLDGSFKNISENKRKTKNMQDHNNINNSEQVIDTIDKRTQLRKTLYDNINNTKSTEMQDNAGTTKESAAITNITKKGFRKLCNFNDDSLDDFNDDKTPAPLKCPYFSTTNRKTTTLKRKREDSNINTTLNELCQPINIINNNESYSTIGSLSLLNDLSHIKPVRRSSLEFAKKPSRESLIRMQTQKPKPKIRTQTIVRTSLHGADITLFELVVQELGKFVISDSVVESTTHVISAEPRRTLNILKGIARGCWILNLDWVKKSREAGRWLDEDDFEWVSFSPAVQRTRIERISFDSSFKMDVFSTYGAIYVSRNSTPTCKDLEDLIKLGSGKVVTNYRIARIVVGEQLRESDIKCVSEKWVLDCIEFYKSKALDNYILDNF